MHYTDELLESILDAEPTTSIVTALDKTTPYMLRSDGALLECSTIHPYIKMFYKDDFEVNYNNLLEHPQFLVWFYNNTLLPETKEAIAELIYLSPELKDLISELNISNPKHFDEIIAVFDRLNYLTNQEFCRVRTSNFKYAYGGDNGEIYFRISSTGFNWFDLI